MVKMKTVWKGRVSQKFFSCIFRVIFPTTMTSSPEGTSSTTSEDSSVIIPVNHWNFRIRHVIKYLPEPACRMDASKVLGEGTFSTVHFALRYDKIVGHSAYERKTFAVKHLVPTASPQRIKAEIECLRLAGGRCNVLPLLFAHRFQGDVVLGMPYVHNFKFSNLVSIIQGEEAQLYMKNLLIALSHIHALGIIHRDVKPANFLYDRHNKRFALIDFGLAQRFTPVQPPVSDPVRESFYLKK